MTEHHPMNSGLVWVVSIGDAITELPELLMEMEKTNFPLTFPVICIDSHGALLAFESYEDLTNTTTSALRRGMYKGFVLYGSNQMRLELSGARVIDYVGPFWGYTLLMTRNVRVALSTKTSAEKAALSAMREDILRSMKRNSLWRSAGAPAAFKHLIEKGSIVEISEAVLGKSLGE